MKKNIYYLVAIATATCFMVYIVQMTSLNAIRLQEPEDHQNRNILKKSLNNSVDSIVSIDHLNYEILRKYAKWNQDVISYKIQVDSNFSAVFPKKTIKEHVEKAFGIWQQVLDIQFLEVDCHEEDDNDKCKSDVLIKFGQHLIHTNRKMEPCTFESKSFLRYVIYFSTVELRALNDAFLYQENDVLAHVIKDSREIHLHYSLLKSMLDAKELKLENLIMILVHEIGHLLGLGHSYRNQAIMSETFNINRSPELDDDDVKGILNIYGQVRRHLMLINTTNAIKTTENIDSFIKCMSLCQNNTEIECLIVSYQHSTQLCHQFASIGNFTTSNHSDWTTVSNSSRVDHLNNFEPFERFQILNDEPSMSFNETDVNNCIEKCSENVECTSVSTFNDSDCFLFNKKTTSLILADNQTSWTTFIKQNKAGKISLFAKINYSLLSLKEKQNENCNSLIMKLKNSEESLKKKLNETNKLVNDKFDFLLKKIESLTLNSIRLPIRTFVGHTGNVEAIVVLPNGLLASGSNDGTIKIWNQMYGYLIRTLRNHTESVNALAVLPNGDLVSGSWDHTVKIWNPLHGNLKRTLNDHTSGVFSLAVLPNGNLASGSFDSTIKIWNPNDGNLLMTLTHHTSNVDALAVLQNGYLVSGSYDNTIKIWNPSDGTLVRTLTDTFDGVCSLAVLPNGDLASGSGDNAIRIWNPLDGSLKQTLTGHTRTVAALAVLKNGYLASGSGDSKIKIWNASNGTLISTLNRHAGYVYSLAVLPNGELASGSADTTIKIEEIIT